MLRFSGFLLFVSLPPCVLYKTQFNVFWIYLFALVKDIFRHGSHGNFVIYSMADFLLFSFNGMF